MPQTLRPVPLATAILDMSILNFVFKYRELRSLQEKRYGPMFLEMLLKLMTGAKPNALCREGCGFSRYTHASTELYATVREYRTIGWGILDKQIFYN